MSIAIKRVYEPPTPDDGYRVLVDRLWPRGLAEEDAHIDLWLRRIAPSDDLRKWFGHDPGRWDEFVMRYEQELEGHEELLDLMGDIERHRKRVTLLFGAKDEERNQAVVLKAVLTARRARRR